MSDSINPIPQLPDGCGYTGNDFGATYPDSQCYGGKLYDLDNCEDGILYEPIDYIPCPQCQHKAWRERFNEEVEMEGWEAAKRGETEEDCPIVHADLKYPSDKRWLIACWKRGFKEYKKTHESK